MPTRLRTMAILGMSLAMVLAGVTGGCGTTTARHSFDLEIPPDTELLAVDVENFRGRVEIRADRGEAGTARVVSDVRSASQARKAEVDATNESVGVEAVIEEIDGRAVLRVRTDSARARGAEEVHLYIEVPRCDGLRVVNRGGTVEAVGTGGTTHIENQDGAIEVRTDRVVERDVTLLGVDGNIYYQIPRGSRGVFSLATLDGEVAMRDFSGRSDDTYSTRRTFETTLNDGPNLVTARTNRGNIRVWVMEDPVALTRMYKGSLPDPDEYIFKQGSRRHTRNLPDDEPRRRGTRSNPGG